MKRFLKSLVLLWFLAAAIIAVPRIKQALRADASIVEYVLHGTPVPTPTPTPTNTPIPTPTSTPKPSPTPVPSISWETERIEDVEEVILEQEAKWPGLDIIDVFRRVPSIGNSYVRMVLRSKGGEHWTDETFAQMLIEELNILISLSESDENVISLYLATFHTGEEKIIENLRVFGEMVCVIPEDGSIISIENGKCDFFPMDRNSRGALPVYTGDHKYFLPPNEVDGE